MVVFSLFEIELINTIWDGRHACASITLSILSPQVSYAIRPAIMSLTRLNEGIFVSRTAKVLHPPSRHP